MMDLKMTDKTLADAERVIAEFLRGHVQPTKEDWDHLLTQYSQFAPSIVDAALLEKAGEVLDDGVGLEPVESGEVFANTISKALNLVYSKPSPQLQEVQEKIRAVQGPAVRQLCTDLGIPSAPLLNGVLVGAVSPPRRLLMALGERFRTSVVALREAFSQSFHARPVPAFKAEDGKPSVSTRPTPWEEAVRNLELSPEQTKSLMAWSSEGE